jgi:glutathione S-transferase
MLKIWGRTSSVNVQKVMWAVAELGLAHERIDAGLHYGGVNEPWYRAMNPNGRVPVIDDDGFVLYESNAIVRYLAAKHGAGTLWPTDLQLRADGDRWMDWATSTLGVPMTPLFWGMIRTLPEQRNLEAIEAERLKTEAIMQILDARLADRPYVAGENFTMGDIPVGCFTYRWYALPMQHGDHPNLKRWYERLQERPAFRTHVMLPLV